MRNIGPRKKYLIGGFLAVLLGIGVVLMLQNRELEIVFDENGVWIVPEKAWFESQVQFNKKLVNLFDRLEEMQAKDNFGGSTPQETFDAFVEALKVGDTELASQYFVFNKQEQMAKELAVGKENGSIEDFLKYVDKIDRGKEYIEIITNIWYLNRFLCKKELCEPKEQISKTNCDYTTDKRDTDCNKNNRGH